MSIGISDRFAAAKQGGRRAGAGSAPTWTLRATALAVASCFAGGVSGNPTGPAVVSGSATIQSQGNLLSITNSPNAIINWQSFSIGASEITRFIQQSASSAVLNRVIGQDPSAILGALQSNGRVFLINPNGIAFGPNATVDVAGLVASTLNMADADFLSGKLRFQQTVGAGGINNQGNIVTPTGGQVYLIAPNIENSGLIRSPQGEIILAAGQSVELVDVGTPDLRVKITAPDNQAVNLGQIVADSGRVGVYAGLISNSGTVSADTVAVGEKGQIIFRASRDIALEEGSSVSASGAPGGVHDGGEVRLIAENTLDTKPGSQVRVDGGADGGHGGFLELSGKRTLHLEGTYSGRAQAPGYRGGSLLIDPDYVEIIDGGSGTVGGVFQVDPADLDPDGTFQDVTLEANFDLTVSSFIANADINAGAPGGSLTLIAGQDFFLNAPIGDSGAVFDHALAFSAGRDAILNSTIYQGAANTSVAAGRDAVVDGGQGGSIYSGGSVALSGANVRVLGGPFSGSDADVSASGNVSLTGSQSVLVKGGTCEDGCGNANVSGANVTLAGGDVTVAGGTDGTFGNGSASVTAEDLVQVTGSSLTVAGGVSGESYYGEGANAQVSGNRVAADVTGGVTVRGGEADGTQQFTIGYAYASIQGYESVAVDAGGAVVVEGGSAGGESYYDARAEIRGGTVDIAGASLLVQGGSAQVTGTGYGGGYSDASARIVATGDANLTFSGAATVRGGTATGNDGYANAQGEISGSSYQVEYAVAAEVIDQPLPDGPVDGVALKLTADSVLLQGGQANAQAGGESSAYADAYAAISDFGSVEVHAAKGVGMAAGVASAVAGDYADAEADARATIFAENLVKVAAGGSIQAVGGSAGATAGEQFSTAEASADAGLSAGVGSIVTDSAGVRLQGGNVTGKGLARAVMVAAADVSSTIQGTGSIDLVPGNDSLGAYAAVVAAPATVNLTFPGRFEGGFSPAGITAGTTGFFTSDDPQSLANLTPAVLGQTLIVTYGLTPPVFPPPGEGGTAVPNNIFVDETNNATNFDVGGNNLPLLEDEDDGKPKQVCS